MGGGREGGGEGGARVAQSDMKRKRIMNNRQVQVLLGYLIHCLKIHGKSCITL